MWLTYNPIPLPQPDLRQPLPGDRSKMRNVDRPARRNHRARSAPCWPGLLILLEVAACSPYNFSPEVMIFSSDVDQVSQGFSTTYAALATDRTERFQTELIDGRAAIVSSKSCEVAVSPDVSGSEAPCQLYRQGGAASQPSDVEVALKRTKDTLQPALQNYTHALAAVTNAADRAAYDAAVGQLASALCGITKAAGPTGAAACQGVTAGVDIIGWLIGQRLDNQRFDSLKAAVNAVGSAPEGRNSAMKIITDALGKGLRDARDKRLSTAERGAGLRENAARANAERRRLSPASCPSRGVGRQHRGAASSRSRRDCERDQYGTQRAGEGGERPVAGAANAAHGATNVLRQGPGFADRAQRGRGATRCLAQADRRREAEKHICIDTELGA